MKFVKSIFNPGNYPNNISMSLLILRVGVGIFMLTHGLGKFSKLFGDEPIVFADPIGIGVTASLALTVFAELFCSILLIAGLATRLAAIPLIITMCVITLFVHGGDAFGMKELPLLFGIVYFAIAIAGAGKYSLDNLITKLINQKRNEPEKISSIAGSFAIGRSSYEVK
jgi:putative oxidoreductase